MKTKFLVWALMGFMVFLVLSFVYGQEIKIKKPFETTIPPKQTPCYYVDRINRIEVKPVPFDLGGEIRIFVAVQVRSTLVNSLNYDDECRKHTMYLTYFVEKETADGHHEWFGQWKDSKGQWTSDPYETRIGSPRAPIAIGSVQGPFFKLLLLEKKEGEQILELPSIKLPLVGTGAPFPGESAVDYEKRASKSRILKIIIEARLHRTPWDTDGGEFTIYDWTRLTFERKFVVSKKEGDKDPDIYSKGTLNLINVVDVDLDKGVVGPKGDVPSADFVWAGGGGSPAYDGVYFYVIGKVDFEKISYSDLLSYSYKLRDLSDVLSNPEEIGTVIAYLTSEGRYGKFKIEDMRPQYLKITYVTYSPSIIKIK